MRNSHVPLAYRLQTADLRLMRRHGARKSVSSKQLQSSWWHVFGSYPLASTILPLGACRRVLLSPSSTWLYFIAVVIYSVSFSATGQLLLDRQPWGLIVPFFVVFVAIWVVAVLIMFSVVHPVLFVCVARTFEYLVTTGAAALAVLASMLLARGSGGPLENDDGRFAVLVVLYTLSFIPGVVMQSAPDTAPVLSQRMCVLQCQCVCYD